MNVLAGWLEHNGGNVHKIGDNSSHWGLTQNDAKCIIWCLTPNDAFRKLRNSCPF